MRYPTLTLSDCRETAEEMLAGHTPAVDIMAKWLGTGEDIDMERISAASRRFHQEWVGHTEKKDRDLVEGKLSPILFESLQDVPVAILDDPSFWRYLSLRFFWNFISWREQGAFERGNHMKYINGRNSTECVLTRMYLRVAALGGLEHAHLAGAVPQSTDFWRSHILRTRTGTVPAVTRALVKMQCDHRMLTSDVRALARALNRTWTNVLLNQYTEDEAHDLIWELRREVTGETKPST